MMFLTFALIIFICMSVMVTLMTSEYFFLLLLNIIRMCFSMKCCMRQLQCLYSSQFNHNTVLTMKMNNYEEIAYLSYTILFTVKL